MLNENEKWFIKAISEAERYAKGELELDCIDGDWYARDYREELGGAFPIEVSGLDVPFITRKEVEDFNIDIVKCCNECGIAYVG